FNLTLIDPLVSMGSGQVSWYIDPAGMIPITETGAFVSGDSIVYAQVTAGSCASYIVPVTLDAVAIPEALDLMPQLCGDTAGLALFDLTQWDAAVSVGTGVVTWYADAAYAVPVIRPDSVLGG